ncbi:hypothetical protein F4775DRAFT_565419 [Biscogniauxia sp. FL1348]|nr:hypothetical protein F4775DRAFT_565419 [Biscogniauxia sp. FL1348]
MQVSTKREKILLTSLPILGGFFLSFFILINFHEIGALRIQHHIYSRPMQDPGYLLYLVVNTILIVLEGHIDRYSVFGYRNLHLLLVLARGAPYAYRHTDISA